MAPLVLTNYNLTLEHLFRKSPTGKLKLIKSNDELYDLKG